MLDRKVIMLSFCIMLNCCYNAFLPHNWHVRFKMASSMKYAMRKRLVILSLILVVVDGVYHVGDKLDYAVDVSRFGVFYTLKELQSGYSHLRVGTGCRLKISKKFSASFRISTPRLLYLTSSPASRSAVCWYYYPEMWSRILVLGQSFRVVYVTEQSS